MRLAYSFLVHLCYPFKGWLQFSLFAILWKTDREMERLHSSETGFANIGAPSLRNFPARLSSPAAFVGFIPSKSLRTFSI